MKRIRVRKQAQHNALVALCCILSLLRHFIGKNIASCEAACCAKALEMPARVVVLSNTLVNRLIFETVNFYYLASQFSFFSSTSCLPSKCINRERMAPAVLLNLFDSWDTGVDRSDHSLISSSSLHFVGIDTVVVALYIWLHPLTLIPPPPAYGRGAESGSRVSIEVNMSMSIHTDMWRKTYLLPTWTNQIDCKGEEVTNYLLFEEPKK